MVPTSSLPGFCRSKSLVVSTFLFFAVGFDIVVSSVVETRTIFHYSITQRSHLDYARCDGLNIRDFTLSLSKGPCRFTDSCRNLALSATPCDHPVAGFPSVTLRSRGFRPTKSPSPTNLLIASPLLLPQYPRPKGEKENPNRQQNTYGK